jgi:hypothetical protein
MVRKIFSIWSVLLVLVISLAVLVPGCEGEPTTGTIEVDATLDGSPWPGAVDYTLTGPGAAAPTVINGASVPGSHSADAGNWTCAYVSGGPGVFVGIIPDPPTQEVTAGATIGFTLNFVTPTQVDAYVTFDSWSINGTPVPGGATYWVGPGTIIDATYKEGVSGNNTGQPVTIHETSWLTVHNTGIDGSGEGPPITLHVVNGAGAVKTDPPSDVSNQQATVEGVPKPVCYKFDLPACQEVHLDAEADLEQEVGTAYTKTINWLRVPAGVVILVDNGAVVFDVDSIGAWQTFTLVSYACVEVGEGFEDTDPSNNCCVASSMITIGFQPPPP